MTYNIPLDSWTSNVALREFVEASKTLCTPTSVHLCTGSQDEYDSLCQLLVDAGSFRKLAKRPGSYWTHSDPSDTARTEERTYICCPDKVDAGPTNNWRDPRKMKEKLTQRFDGCMQGRTMYVMPYSMGPSGGAISQLGVEITDSAYVVVSLKIMTRVGQHVLDQFNRNLPFCAGLHSVGMPLKDGAQDVVWPCNPKKYIVHFPHERLIWSFGSGYGGNALLDKKCFALRIASCMARDQGWLAEHMLILGLTSPQGEKKYFCAAFPSGCGKTNLAMLQSTLPDWRVECVGDDIAWLKFADDGALYAINPEAGFFGIAPGTNLKSSPNGLRCCDRDVIFTNTGVTDDGDVWWEGLSDTKPPGLRTWLDVPYTGDSIVSHPNARFTAPLRNCPSLSPEAENRNGVPISGIIFGGRRPSLVPLVYESRSWAHGVLIGAMTSSETTAAVVGQVGRLRHDPFSMLPFCGYNMADYFQHWLDMGVAKAANRQPADAQAATSTVGLPKIFGVNWFRRGASSGGFLWPGFCENVRVLKWMFERCNGTGVGTETPIGVLPRFDADGKSGGLDVSGLNLPADADLLLKVDTAGWQQELNETRRYVSQFGDRTPVQLLNEIATLEAALSQ